MKDDEKKELVQALLTAMVKDGYGAELATMVNLGAALNAKANMDQYNPFPQTQVQPEQQAPKTDVEIMVDDFMRLDAEVNGLIEKFNSGDILPELVPTTPLPPGATIGDLIAQMKFAWGSFMEYLRQKVEERNQMVTTIAAAMRSKVMAAEGTKRGVDGRSTTVNVGPFEVSSRTTRRFDPDKLFEALKEKGLYGRLFEITFVDDKSGKIMPAVQQRWEIDFGTVKNFLRETNLNDVIEQAYVEEELTPAVTGPKEVGLLGSVKKKGGKKA